MQEYYRTCGDYFVRLRKKSFDYWFSAYYSAIREKSGWILDVGCGVGQVVNRLTSNGFAAVGIDVSPIGIRMAVKQGMGAFVVASGGNLPFRSCSFASVGCHDFLEHTSKPEMCLGEMVRVLGNCGKVVVSAPNFLRVIGLSREYHWHMAGLRQRASNLLSLMQKAVMSKISPNRMRFEFMPAELDPKGRGGDADAVCVTNPIDIRFHLVKLGVRIIFQSAAPGYEEGIIEKLGKLPFIRSVSSSAFLVGTKMVGQNGEDTSH